MSMSPKPFSLAGAFVAAGLLFGPSLAPVVAEPKPRKVKVRCDAGETIGGAISRLDPLVPAVVQVSGTCRENVLIRGFDDLSIVGAAGATLEVVAPPAPYAIEVATSRRVSLESLTIQGTGDRVAIGLGGCGECRVTAVTVNGGIALNAYNFSNVKLSHFRATGTGGWASVGAWSSVLGVEDSVFEDTSGGPGRWCGLCVGENASVGVSRSSFRGYGQGMGTGSGAHLQLYDGTIIEENWCAGVNATTGAALTVHTGTRVANNGSGCFGGGISVDTAATLSFVSDNVPGRRVEVVNNVGSGIALNHRAVAYLDADSLVSGNTAWWGLSVSNGSMAVASFPWASPPRTISISGNPVGDLLCDSISHINNAAQITGATNNSCVNLSSDDEPGAP